MEIILFNKTITMTIVSSYLQFNLKTTLVFRRNTITFSRKSNMGRISRGFEFCQNTGKRRKEKSCIQAAIMECLQLSVNKGVLKTILQCNNPSRRGNRQSFPRSLASSTFAYLPNNLKIQRTSRRIVFQPDRVYLSLIFASPNRFVQDQV